jgi:hypothetical protein
MSGVKLLREYIREVLTEDEAPYDYGSMYLSDANVGPYGVHFGSGKDLYHIFIEPFTDVVKTAAGKGKEISQKAQTLGKVVFETIATTLIPVLTDSYKEIFEHEQQEIDKIRKEYDEVYQSNWDAFKDNDVLTVAFFYSPAALLTTQFARKSPLVVSSLLSVLSGGQLDPWLTKVKHRFGWDRESHANTSKIKGGGDHGGSNFWGGGADYYYDGGGGHDGGHSNEGVIREEEEKAQQPDPGILVNKKVLSVIQNSPVVQKMEQEGQAIVHDTLSKVFKQASGALSAKSLQQLQQKTGVHLKGMDQLNQIPQQQRAQAEQALLKGAHNSIKEFYIKNLEGQVKAAHEAGVPDSHPYIQDYNSVIAKIKAL